MDRMTGLEGLPQVVRDRIAAKFAAQWTHVAPDGREIRGTEARCRELQARFGGTVRQP